MRAPESRGLQAADRPGFEAAHFAPTARFRLSAPADRVFPLFTPEGERRWVAGWQPEYLPSQPGGLAAGQVFRTHVDGEETLWLVSRFEPRQREVEYVRIVPGSRMGTVRIRCRPSGQATEVIVRYRLTALSAEGNARLADLAAGGFTTMIAGWKQRLRLLFDREQAMLEGASP